MNAVVTDKLGAVGFGWLPMTDLVGVGHPEADQVRRWHRPQAVSAGSSALTASSWLEPRIATSRAQE